MALSKKLSWNLLSLVFVLGLIASSSLIPAFRSVAAQGGIEEEDSFDEEDGAESEVERAASSEVVSSAADEDTSSSEEEEEEIKLLAAPGVETAFFFPDLPKGKPMPTIHAGQKVVLLVGVNNQGVEPLNVWGIRANLYLPYDYRYVVQNFTSQVFNTTVNPGDQASFSIAFAPEKLLQPREFGLSASLFYEVLSHPHASVVFNSTVDMLEPVGFVSGESIFLGLLGVGVLSLVGMWLYGQVEKAAKKSKKAKKIERGTGENDADVADNEWLKGTFAVQTTTKSSTQPRKSAKKRYA